MRSFVRIPGVEGGRSDLETGRVNDTDGTLEKIGGGEGRGE